MSRQNSASLMLFNNKIRRLREKLQMPQRQAAAFLGIDTATYSKIENGARHARRNQVLLLARLLHSSPEELLSLWLADQVTAIIAHDKTIAGKVLELVTQNINNENTQQLFQ